MIAIGILLLLAAVGLIWFRTPLTGTRIGDGDIPFSISSLTNPAKRRCFGLPG